MRSSPMPAMLLAALAAGAVAGAAAGVLVAPTSSGPRPEAAATPAEDEAPDPVATQLEELRRSVRALERRLAEAEWRPAETAREPAAPDAAAATREELRALRDELERALAGSAAPRERNDALDERVAVALESIRKEERVEAVRGYQEKRRERLRETLPKIQEQLELSARQTGELESALLAQYEREEELVRMWEEGVDPELLAERKQEDARTFRGELEGFLAPEQVQQLWSWIERRGGK